MPPRERLEILCDPGSVRVIRSVVRDPAVSGSTAGGDAVVGASATIDGRPVFCYAEDGNCAGGSIDEARAETIVRILDLAGVARVPVIGFMESIGGRASDGTGAPDAYARVLRANVALSRCVPQISIITGSSSGGACCSPALADFVIMTRHASMSLSGPEAGFQALGERASPEELGGARVHERTGVCQIVATTEFDAAERAREVLSYLPQSTFDRPPVVAPESAVAENPGAPVPRETSRVYDVREVVRGIVDAGRILEIAPKWARNLVTCLVRLEGRSVGVVANQPRYLGGVLDSSATQKGARFVRMCGAFGIPLVVLVDTPGFMPGIRQESAGVLRQSAELIHAFTRASVPRVTVVLRQAHGGGGITMNSRGIGADFVYAWPRAAFREGTIDQVILPADTRAQLSAVLDVLGPRGGARGR